MTPFFKEHGKAFIKIHNAKDISVEELFQAFKERIVFEKNQKQDGKMEEEDIEELLPTLFNIMVRDDLTLSELSDKIDAMGKTNDDSIIELTDIVE
jgi:hypothetical protein